MALCLSLSLYLNATKRNVSNTSDSGPGSLRQAIADASNGDTITFTANGAIILSSALDASKNLTIIGPGANKLSISGNNSVEIFKENAYALNTFYVSGLEIKNAYSSSYGAAFDFAGANITIKDCNIHHNSGSGYGIAISLWSVGSSLYIENTSIHSNTCTGYASGIYIKEGGDLTIKNSTLYANNGLFHGQAIMVEGSHVSLTNVTIAGTTGGNDVIFVEDYEDHMSHTLIKSASVNFSNCIIDNTVKNYTFSGLSNNTVTSGGYNICNDNSLSSDLTSTGDQNNKIALLDPNGIQNNGGTTPTVALQCGSPAINAGSLVLSKDQRGNSRVGTPDIGPFESNILAVNYTVSVSGNTLTSNESGAAYQWLKDNAILNGATQNSYTASAAGKYSVIISKYGCGDTSENKSIVIQQQLGWKSISAGSISVTGLKNDGTIWAWGGNLFGNLGLGHSNDEYLPVQIGSDNNWTQISGGLFHTLALQNDSSLWAWGSNFYGQVGDGTSNPVAVPTKISSDKWIAIFAGGVNSFAIKADGTLWAWGDNGYNQVFAGNTSDQLDFMQIGTSTWKKISGGSNHVMGIKSDNTLWAWGDNYYGQFGDGSNSASANPVQIGNQQWKDLAAGKDHTIAIQSDGTLWAWGNNLYGGLGTGNTNAVNTPLQIGVENTWNTVYAPNFSSYSFALKNDKSLWSWGVNYYGQLGAGTHNDIYTPLKIGSDSWDIITLGTDFSMGIKSSNSSSYCGTGYNGYGQLGTNNITDTIIFICDGDINTSVSDLSSKSMIKLYPNPNNGNFLIQTPLPGNFEIVNELGQTIQSFQLNTENNYTINVINLESGLYFLRGNSNGKQLTEKIIVLN